MRKNYLLDIILLITVILFFPTKQAYAYIDPGSGSQLIQIVVGAVLGVGFAFRYAVGGIINKLRMKKKKK